MSNGAEWTQEQIDAWLRLEEFHRALIEAAPGTDEALLQAAEALEDAQIEFHSVFARSA